MLDLKFVIKELHKSVFTGLLSRHMQYGLNNHQPRDLFKHWVNVVSQSQLSSHTDCILIQWAWVKKMMSQMKPEFIKISLKRFMRLWSCEKVMGSCTAIKCCCFVWNLHERVIIFELACLKKKKEEKEDETTFGLLATFWCDTFAKLFCTTMSLVGHEHTWRLMIDMLS